MSKTSLSEAKAGPDTSAARRRRAGAWRLLAAAGSVALHLGLLLALVLEPAAGDAPPSQSSPVFLTLAPPAAPPTPTADTPGEVAEDASQPKTIDALRPTTPVQARPVAAPGSSSLTTTPDTAAAAVAPRQREDRPATAVSSAAAPPTPSAPPATRAAGSVVETWQGRVLARLETHRRYPPAARRRRLQGVAHVRFSVDRAGRVLDVQLARSAGSAELDREAVANVRRASPLPEPPADVPGAVVELVVPVDFSLR